jgi:hypothetical protein
MKHKKAAVAVALLGLAAGSTAFGATQAGGTDPLDDVAILKTGQPAELSPDERQSLITPDTADYGLDLSGARVAASNAATRGASASLDGTWIVIPGEEGFCLVPGDQSLLCGAIESFKKGQLAMTTVPTAGQPYVRGEMPSVGPGAGKVQGVVPDGYTRVVVVDKGGAEIASTTVVNNVYELDVPTFRQLKDVQLLNENGSTTTLPLGWDR